MRVEVQSGRDPGRTRGAVVAIGVFDGVHLGHQRLIAAAIREASRRGLTSAALTFEPDPQRVLHPAHASPPLISLAARVALIRKLGVDGVCVAHFTRSFSRLSPTLFIERVLIERLRARCVVVGRNFCFGRDRRGDVAALRRLASAHGIAVVDVPPALRGGRPISSSRIRACLLAGDVVSANRLLGRPVQLAGTVVRGDGRATRLGFPTANLSIRDQLLPANGVYAGWAHTRARRWPAVVNIGRRPTFGGTRVVCEAHLIGFHGSLYGRELRVDLLRRLRAERAFSGAGALTRQIARDVSRARALLTR